MMVDLSSVGTSFSSFKGGLAGMATYAWVLWFVLPIALIIFVGVLIKTLKDKKKQWTHRLRIRKVLANGGLTPETIIKIKRFPLIKGVGVFELETPLLGKWLMPELDSYTGTNEFSIILGTNNRIYINTGEYFCPESSSVKVSAKHAGIDLAFEDLGGDWGHQYKTDKRVEWQQVAKFALLGILIIASMIVLIKGIGQWGENHQIDAEKSRAEAEAMSQLAEAMKTSQATMNTQVLVLDLLKKHYGTNNIQEIIRSKTNATIQ